MANKKTRQIEIQNANKAKRDMAKKKLGTWPVFTALALIVTALLMFVPFMDIYNDPNVEGAFNASANGGRPFVEIGAGGWQCAFIALTHNYTSAESALAPFYYWVTSEGGQPYVSMLAVASLAAAAALVISLILQTVVYFTKAHTLSLIAVVADFVMAAAFFIAFAAALSCGETMLAGYCNNNPACSLRSFAIIPALASLGVLALDVIHFIKFRQAEKLSG